MSSPHPIPYQGSKRALAPTIISYFPSESRRLIEPFAGSAAVSLAAASAGRIQTIHLNDINDALINLWLHIIRHPNDLACGYENLWHTQEGNEREFYNTVRREFNKSKSPETFLYLLARCVKASVRYNVSGEFNQSPDNRRKGMHPTTMRKHILIASYLFAQKTILTSVDYRTVLEKATPEDIVYMDPPYQGVSSNRDSRYINNIPFYEFVSSLQSLNSRRISYILSYDGRTGNKTFGRSLPEALGLAHLEINAGSSSQATLLGRTVNTYEALYLSPALIERLDRRPQIGIQLPLLGAAL